MFGTDRTVTASNGVTVNGGSAQDIRFSGGGDQTLKANKVNIVTIIIQTDSGNNTRSIRNSR